MREIIIKENDANQRLDKFLSKTLKKLPTSLMYKYIRNKKIKVNGKRCENKQILMKDDVLTCYIAEEFFEFEKDDLFLQATKPLDVVYEDANIIVMNKEIGLLSHSESEQDIDTLVNRMKYYLYQKKEYDFYEEQSFAPALCHRLDRNTQGLVIGAKNAESLRLINQMIKEQKIHKYYLAIVEGHMESKQGLLIHYHKKENQKIYIYDYQEHDSKEIKTAYKVLDVKEKYSLIEVELFSGKSHQIRAQFAHIHHPLYGDVKYKAKKQAFQYQALCAYKLQFKVDETSVLNYLNQKMIVLEDVSIRTLFRKL